ncbi:MAG: DNA topoisomerase I [Nanoarchaeota archaeon]|nr:DNA topoisomerase I [Nanoarchaeota archaeon]
MIKRNKKTAEEKNAEDYFPVEKKDIRYSVEKEVKPSKIDIKQKVEVAYTKPDRASLETVEKIGKTGKRSYNYKKTSYPKTSKEKKPAAKTRIYSKTPKEYTPVKISLKKDGYELIITEKPQAAMKIASALGTPSKRDIHGIPYYNVSRNGKNIVVACAVGHLFTLQQQENGKIPIFNIKWVPNYLVRKADFTKKYYDALLSLAKNAGSITVATDYDVEGEVIGLNVVRFICSQSDASRMKFSTLTDKELNESYEKKLNHLDWGQAIAGETRHYLDWFYGINLSRALMNSIKAAGSFKIMSIGRVQGPSLNLIVKKEIDIQKFKPTPYWQVFINVKDSKNQTLELKYIKDITKEQDLKKFSDLKGKKGIAETKKSEQKLSPLPPFNLTVLQTEAYRLFGITPSRTLQIAQSLYLAGLISYPRTSSQKLPPSIAYKEILDKLSKKYNVEHLIKRANPIEGSKSDPAHPSIYPTGNFQVLGSEEEKMYNLIAKRFLSLFCEDAIIDNKTIKVSVSNLDFSAKGSSVRKKAWLEIYPLKMQEKEIPDLSGEVLVTSSKIEQKETQPPKRYSPASIVSELEKRNIGTKSTRAAIIETLYDRGYIKEKSIEATPLGISLIETLEKYSPIIIDEALTRHFEKEMDSIISSKKDMKQKEEKIVDEAKEAITKIINNFDKNEEKIGKELIEANNNLRQQEREENKITPCPVCKKGSLAITYSRKNRKYFVACNAYPDCKTTFSLPPNGLIKKTDKICEFCKWPMLIRLAKGKRPWIFCFNPACESRQAKKQEEKEES